MQSCEELIQGAYIMIKIDLLKDSVMTIHLRMLVTPLKIMQLQQKQPINGVEVEIKK